LLTNKENHGDENITSVILDR